MIEYFFCTRSIYDIIVWCSGDLYDERKEGTQTQISSHAVGSADYHTHDLVYVHSGM